MLANKMRLSEQLRRDHESGDFGNALEGYAERAEQLERGFERYQDARRIFCDFVFPGEGKTMTEQSLKHWWSAVEGK